MSSAGGRAEKDQPRWHLAARGPPYITMLVGLLNQIPDPDGALISMDAMHAQRKHAAYLHKRGASRFFDLNPVVAEATTQHDWLFVDRVH